MIEVLETGFDYVVDAIDTLSPKIFLIYHSLQRKYPVVSSMGAGGKFDPTKVCISDISADNRLFTGPDIEKTAAQAGCQGRLYCSLFS